MRQIDGQIHCLHVYTGDGKGKTSMALGCAVRMRGHDKKVLFAQFLKNGKSGELTSLQKLNVFIESMPALTGFYSRMHETEKKNYADVQCEALKGLAERIIRMTPDMVILDELCVALSLNVIREEQAKNLILVSMKCGETIVTGRGAPGWLLNMADYVTVLEARKHPFLNGLKAREGIEW